MWTAIAAISGALAVAAGAFGAHGLREKVTPDQLNAWTTACQYHLVHSVVLLALALYATGAAGGGDKAIRIPAWLFLTGMLLFSGSIYALVLTGQRWLGPITPMGGLLLIAGWISLIFVAGSKSP
ncbi:MAG TPA: DUF423 domain-containing protein [Myxococcales bacterium]|jgi:uncharacterized membrane protein YgdD (TMEM256/DUF423 family)|nr:DUF423 domain-containing protein [Myxococcales bacterium]